LTGHSLGGFEARIVGALLSIPSVTFNAPPLPRTLARRYGIPNSPDNNDFNFARIGDFTDWGAFLGKAVVQPGHQLVVGDSPMTILVQAASPISQQILTLTKEAFEYDPRTGLFLLSPPDTKPAIQIPASTAPRDTKAGQPDETRNHGNSSDTTSPTKTPTDQRFTALDRPLFSLRVADGGSGDKSVDVPESKGQPCAPAATPVAGGQNDAGDVDDEAGLTVTTFVKRTGEVTAVDSSNEVQTVVGNKAGTPVDENKTGSDGNGKADDSETVAEDAWADRYLNTAMRAREAFLNALFLASPPGVDPAPPGIDDDQSSRGHLTILRGGKPTELRLLSPNVDPWPTDFLSEDKASQGSSNCPPNLTTGCRMDFAIDPLPPNVREAESPPPKLPKEPVDRGGSGSNERPNRCLGVSNRAALKIGVAGPLTGPNASFGAQMTECVCLAAEDFNKAGGILGQEIEVEQGDDVSDLKEGVSVANRFVGDGVKFVVGHFNSGVTILASDVYAENGVLFITPSAGVPKITDSKLWDAFRTCGRDDQQAKLWADLAVGRLKNARIAIVHDNRSYGMSLAEAAKRYMNSDGKKEVLFDAVNSSARDYSAIVSKISASGADYVMWGGTSAEGAQIVREMRDRGMRTIMISGNGIGGNGFASIGGPGVVGTLMSSNPKARNNPAAKDVVAKFKAEGFEPEGYTLYSYAAMQIFKQAAEKAKSLAPKKMAEVMHSGMPFHTVLGDISYDKKGDRTTFDYVWYIWEKGPDGKIGFKQPPP
jgi:branched-chain amino acid transport system substrate-binding protein